MAGVIIASPKNSAVANTPSSTIPAPQRRVSVNWLISASSARLPPSPRLSARISTVTYLIVTMISIDQNIRLMMP